MHFSLNPILRRKKEEEESLCEKISVIEYKTSKYDIKCHL